MENGHLAVGTNVSESGGLQAFAGALGPDQTPIVAGAFNDPNLLILTFRFELIRRDPEQPVSTNSPQSSSQIRPSQIDSGPAHS